MECGPRILMVVVTRSRARSVPSTLIPDAQRLARSMVNRALSQVVEAYAGPAGRAALNAGRYLMSRGTQTSSKNMSRTTYSQGRLGGFVGPKVKRRRARTARGRKLQSKRMRKYSRKIIAKGGVEYCTEVVGEVTDSNAIYIGHGAFSPQNVFKYFVYSMVKMILNHGGVAFNNWDTPIGQDLPVGAVIGFGYRPTQVTTPVDINEAVVSGDSYNSFANRFWIKFYGIIDNGSLSEKSVPEYIILNKGSGAQHDTTKIPVNAVVVDVLSKDSIKIQNRTIAVEGDQESTDVDNVPLTGKIYYSNGNYFEPKNELADENFVCGRLSNVLSVAAGTDKYVQEPPQAYYFKSTKAMKIRINPGDIKTNSITFKKSYSLGRFIAVLKSFWYNASGQSDADNRHKEGRCVMFGLEKVIGTGSDTQGVKVKYEVQQHLWINIRANEVNFTCQIVE